MTCPACQAPVTPGAAYCAGCGARLSEAPSAFAACAAHPKVRAAQACPRCGTFACAECLVLQPDGTPLCRACEAGGQAALLPWDRREELGTFKAYWRTCLELIGKPRVTFDRARAGGTLGSSLGFTVLSTLAGMLTTLVLYAFIFIGVFAFMAGKGTEKPLFGDAGPVAVVFIGLAIFVGYLLLLVGMSLASTLVMGSLDHLVLKLAGVNPVWGVTIRAYSLSMAPYLVGLVPICGLYVYPIWSLVLRVFAYKSLHRTSWGKAVAGALVPTVSLVFLVVAGYVVLIAFVATAGRS